MDENARQYAHIAFGLLVIAAVLAVGREAAVAALFAGLVAGMVVLNAKLLGAHNRAVDFLLQKLDRPSGLPGGGAFFYVVGLLLLLTFPRDVATSLALVGILAVGDGLSTLVGRAGKTKLFWNPRKSVRGLAAFVAGGFLAGAAFLPAAFAFSYALSLAVVETTPVDVDDNLWVSLGAVVLNVAFTGGVWA